MSTNTSKMDRQKEQAIAAPLLKPTIGEAAAEIGVGYATHRRSLQDPGFADEYRRARRTLKSNVGAQLQRAATDAVAALVEIVKDTEAPAAARESGARVILDMSARSTELEDIDARQRLFRHKRTDGSGRGA